jgi:hypothetical protein
MIFIYAGKMKPKNIALFFWSFTAIFILLVTACQSPPAEVNRFLYGDLAIVPFERSLKFIDVSRPTQPRMTASLEIGSPIRQVILFDHYAAVLRMEDFDYVANNLSAPGGIAFVDLTNPKSPAIIGEITQPAYPNTLFVVENTAYVSDYLGVYRLDISNPANPILIEHFPAETSNGNLVFVQQNDGVLSLGGNCNFRSGGCQGDIAIYLLQNNRLEQQQQLSIDLPVYDAVVKDGFLYTIGRGFAAAPFDHPEQLEQHHQSENFAFYQGKIISNDQNLFAIGDHRLLVLDVSNPLQPTPIGIESSAPEGTYFLDLAYQEPYVLMVSQYGLHVLDVTDPAAPLGAAFLGLADEPK